VASRPSFHRLRPRGRAHTPGIHDFGDYLACHSRDISPALPDMCPPSLAGFVFLAPAAMRAGGAVGEGNELVHGRPSFVLTSALAISHRKPIRKQRSKKRSRMAERDESSRHDYALPIRSHERGIRCTFVS
jgi:hypothetical protein